MELGELELAVLRAVRTLGEASSGDVFAEMRKNRDVAYTSVTTTLYRLVDKDLVAVRKESEKRAYYRIKDGKAYRKAMASMVDRLVGTFGSAAVSYLLENDETLPADELVALRGQVERRRRRENQDG